MPDRNENEDVLSEEDVHLDNEVGTPLDWADFENEIWLYREDLDKVVEQSDRDFIEDIQKMLDEDGKARSIFMALSFPIRMATMSLEKPDEDEGQTEWLRDTFMAPCEDGGMETPLRQIVSQMTYAFATKRQYFEKVFTKLDDGKIGYKKVVWRPPSSCELLRDKKSGDIEGYRQWVGSELSGAEPDQEGYVTIPKENAFVFLNGTDRDPYFGASDMSVAHWAWDLKRKIVALWHFHLEGEAQNRILVYGNTQEKANARAKAIKNLRASGVLGVKRSDDEDVFEKIEGSGESGRLTFKDIISYLDQVMSNSIMAGWLDLTDSTSPGNNTGSYALSADQSGLFISSRYAAAQDVADAVTQHLIAPLVRINFGPKAKVPKLKIEKIDDNQAEQTFELLNTLGVAQTLQLPEEFLHMLLERVASYLELPTEDVEKMIKEEKKRLDKKREQADIAAQQQIDGTDPNAQPNQPGTSNGGTPAGQQGQPGARSADASRQSTTKTVQAMQNVTKRAQRGKSSPTNSAPSGGSK